MNTKNSNNDFDQINSDDEIEMKSFTSQISSIVSNTFHIRKNIADALSNSFSNTPINELECVVSMLVLSAVTCKDVKIDKEQFLSFCEVIYTLFDRATGDQLDIGEKHLGGMIN
jgi:F0F1-type ATP synthase membrane subunit a